MLLPEDIQMNLIGSTMEDKVGLETEDDINKLDKSSVAEAVLWSTDWTTETIISQLKKGNIELDPSFQRRDAWGDDRKSSFIESIILGLPIPQIILAESKVKKGSYLVIDGKQRLLSVRQFGVTDEKDEFTALKLKRLKILSDLNGKEYTDIINDTKLSEYRTAFENQAIRTVIIKNWPNQDFLYTVFLRLNTGSLPLSPQELRQALNPGEFTTFVDSFSTNSSAIKKILGLEKPDYRMRDVEVLVRFFAFKNFIEDYSGALKEFLDRACLKLNNSWETDNSNIIQQAKSLEYAIEVTYNIFGDNAFSKFSTSGFTKQFNRPVYDIMTYYFSDGSISDQAIKQKDMVVEAFKDLCIKDIEFLRGLETSTKDTRNTAKRFNAWGLALKGITNLSFEIPTRVENEGRLGIKLI